MNRIVFKIFYLPIASAIFRKRFGQVSEAAFDIVAVENGIDESKAEFVRAVMKQTSQIMSLNQDLVTDKVNLRNVMLTSGNHGGGWRGLPISFLQDDNHDLDIMSRTPPRNKTH